MLLHYAAPPVVGGVESVIGHHSRRMAEAGHQVRIVAGRGAQVDQAVQFVHLPLADSQHPDVLMLRAELNRGVVSSSFSSMVNELSASLGQVTAATDWLIAHNVCSLNKNLALTAALRRIVADTSAPRLMLWHHDLAWTTPRYRDELHAGYPWDLLRTAWPNTIQITVSEFRRRELAALLEIPEDRIRVIPNGLDAARFLKLEALTKQFVQRLSIMDAWPILLLPVRITSRKNIELSLRVLAVLREKYPRAILVVTGPLGPHNPANKDYFAGLLALRTELGLEGAAIFLAELTSEFLPDEVVSDFYRLADLLFLPSREEGFGIPVLEAGLTGMPVFCTDIAPLRELGASQVTYFSPDADPATISQLIMEHLSSNPVLALRERIRSEYTWDQIYQNQIAPLLDSREPSA